MDDRHEFQEERPPKDTVVPDVKTGNDLDTHRCWTGQYSDTHFIRNSVQITFRHTFH
jgi:hypothetical protein